MRFMLSWYFICNINYPYSGLFYQHAGARDEKGNPIIKDFFSSPLTARYASLKSNKNQTTSV